MGEKNPQLKSSEECQRVKKKKKEKRVKTRTQIHKRREGFDGNNSRWALVCER